MNCLTPRVTFAFLRAASALSRDQKVLDIATTATALEGCMGDQLRFMAILAELTPIHSRSNHVLLASAG